MELQQLYTAPEDQSGLKTGAAGNEDYISLKDNLEMAFSKSSSLVAAKIGCMAMVPLVPLPS